MEEGRNDRYGGEKKRRIDMEERKDKHEYEEEGEEEGQTWLERRTI